MRPLLVYILLMGLSGCIGTVSKVVTAPVKAGAQAADWATTSQDEADRNRGREERKAEERAHEQCRKSGRDDC